MLPATMAKSHDLQIYKAQIDDLLAQKSFAEKIINVMPSIVYIFDLQTQSIIYVNDQVKDILNLTPDEFKAMGATFYTQVMHPDDLPMLMAAQGRVDTLKDNELVELEYRVRTRASSYRWVSDRICIFSRDEAGKVQRVLGVATDIDDRKRAQENVRFAAEKMNLSLDAAKMGTWDWDATKEVLYWDRRMYELHDALDMQHLPVTEVIKNKMMTEDWEYTRDRSFEALKAGGNYDITYRIKLRTGEIRYMRSYGRTIGEPGSNMSGVGWDVTEETLSNQKMAETRAALVASTKMAALGEMSGGIAHEINNPLTVIQARAFQLNQMIEANAIDPQKIQQAAEAISRTAEKIGRIIKSLRAFARDGAYDPYELVPVKNLINETLEFCRTRFFHHSIEIEVENIPEDLEIECRQVQIGQVLLNLLNNSFDALAEYPEKWIRIQVIDLDEKVEIRVKDSGTGIPTQIIDKIMHPFFTTKEVGKGTGLGLSISSGIIKSHGGELYVDTLSPNTTFVIRLPKMQNPEE